MNDDSVHVEFHIELVFIKCVLIGICALFAFGCGTTKWSDTDRTGTEQLLISNAIDRVANKVDFSPMRGKKSFLDSSAISQNIDRDYLAMTLRQQLAAAGAILAASKEEADYIVEVRAGAIGTDRDDLLIGVPAMTLPAIPSSQYSATVIPEIPFIKQTRQRGVAKIALFAYNKTTGTPVWISGNNQGESSARNLWFAGAGPLTRGTIYHETTFAGNPVPQWTRSTSNVIVERSQVFPEMVRPEMVQPETVQSETIQPPTLPFPLNPFPPVSGGSRTP